MISFNPTTLPGYGSGCAFSADGKYMAVAHSASPYISIYKYTNGAYEKLANPATLPTGDASGCAFSADGVYLAVAYSNSPYITIYKRSGDTFTKLSNPGTLPAGTALGCSFSTDGVYLAVAHSNSPYITIYKRSGDTFTKLTNPSSLPTDIARGCKFSSDASYLTVASHEAGTALLYSRSGDTFTKMTVPSSGGTYGQCCAISGDGVYFAVGNNLSSVLAIYKRSGSTITKLTDPTTMPPASVSFCEFSVDGKFLIVGNASTPYIIIYRRTGDAFTVIDVPSAVTAAGMWATAFNADGDMLACAPRLLTTSMRAYTVRAISMIPTQAQVAPKALQTEFSWNIESDIPAMWPNTQISARLRWRPQGTTPYTEINISGSTNSYTMPANIFSTEYVEWQVVIEYETGKFTDDANWITFSTNDAIPNKPTLENPDSQYVETNKPIIFEWQHNINTGTAQKAADLQYSYEGGPWTSLAAITGAGNTYTCPANTLSAGDLRWKAKTYNTDNVAGEWSEPVLFVGIGSPAAPVISGVSISARPTISWQASGQLAFQVQVTKEAKVIYDSGTVNSSAKQHKITAFLEDGAHKVYVRIQNNSTKWSDWSSIDISVNTVKPSAPTVTTESIMYGVRILFSDVDAAATSLVVYRDGKPIAQLDTDAAQWDDYSSVGECEYVLRVVAGDVFEDSEAVTAAPSMSGRVVAAVSDLSEIVDLRYSKDDRPSRNLSYQSGAVTTKFEGRNRPAADRPDAAQLTLSFDAAFSSGDDLDKLIEIFDTVQAILYRDSLGRKYYGTIESFSAKEKATITDVNLTIQTTDYDEVIDIA